MRTILYILLFIALVLCTVNECNSQPKNNTANTIIQKGNIVQVDTAYWNQIAKSINYCNIVVNQCDSLKSTFSETLILQQKTINLLNKDNQNCNKIVDEQYILIENQKILTEEIILKNKKERKKHILEIIGISLITFIGGALIL